MHRGFEHLPSLWPRARFVHLLRDPRDVAASIVVEGWAGNAFEGAEQWRATEEAWDRLRDRIRPQDWIEVRFEDLARDPLGTLTGICEFVGLPYREEMMRYDYLEKGKEVPKPMMDQVRNAVGAVMRQYAVSFVHRINEIRIMAAQY